MSSRNLSDLVPDLQRRARKFLDKTHTAGIDVLIYCTARDTADQLDNWKKGRAYILGRWVVTNAKAVVTWAMPGSSFHEYGCAFDFVPMRAGKPVWDDRTPADAALWSACGSIAEECGLVWGGRWAGKKKDGPHCQWSAGLTVAELRAGKVPHYTPGAP